MLKRCYSKCYKTFHDYGGRGITVCDEWKSNFHQLLSDMGNRPSSSHSIERNDNDGPYSPMNCRWATRKEQARNTRRNRKITFNGETMAMSAWAERIGITNRALWHRLARGWDIARALSPAPAAKALPAVQYLPIKGQHERNP